MESFWVKEVWLQKLLWSLGMHLEAVSANCGVISLGNDALATGRMSLLGNVPLARMVISLYCLSSQGAGPTVLLLLFLHLWGNLT